MGPGEEATAGHTAAAEVAQLMALEALAAHMEAPAAAPGQVLSREVMAQTPQH